jgi:hypothetical protein
MIYDGGGGVCGVRGIDIDVDGQEIRARQCTGEQERSGITGEILAKFDHA